MAEPAFFAASYCVSELVKYVVFGRTSIKYGDVFDYDMLKGERVDWEAPDGPVAQSRKLVEAFVVGGREAMIECWLRQVEQREKGAT